MFFAAMRQGQPSRIGMLGAMSRSCGQRLTAEKFLSSGAHSGQERAYSVADQGYQLHPETAFLTNVFALCESSARLALNALGLDPVIGYLHLPRSNRDSLALDI